MLKRIEISNRIEQLSKLENTVLSLIEQLKTAEGVTESLKANDPMAWVQRMNSIRARAEEIVREEIIYGEAAV